MRKGEDIVGLTWVVVIGGVIVALFTIIAYFSSFGLLNNVIGIQGGVNVIVTVDEKGAGAAAVSALTVQRHTVMEVLGVQGLTTPPTEQEEWEKLKELIEKNDDITGIRIYDGSGNTIKQIGNPVNPVRLTIPLPGGEIGEVDIG